MAAAYAALVSLLNNIDQMMKHPLISTSLDNDQIQPLLEKAEFLLDFMEKNNYGGGSKEAEDLERQITSAAHAAEDVIESYIVDQIHAGMNLGSSLDLQQINEDMDAVKAKAVELKEKWGGGSREEEQPPAHSRVVAALMETGESSSHTRTRMVGLDDELIQILDELTGNKHPSSLHAISIVGMGGMGKTTFARNVYENSYIMQHFVIRAWATVSEQHGAVNILSQLLSSQGKSPSGSSVDSLGEQLHKNLSGRRYLIILDDVWSVGAWDSVRRFFPDNGNGSRVVLTTRLTNVAKDCGTSVFRMNLLDEGKSWELFCEKTVFPSKDDPLELIDVGKEIVRSCKGLALSIVVIGGLLLKSPRTVGLWESVANDLNSIPNFKEKKEDSLEVLSLSYKHLPLHLKPCFLYMGVFKEDSEIRISKITKLWVAEGFVKANVVGVAEEIAEGYLKDLIDRNLVLVGRLRKNGEIGSCGVHDLLRDLCLKLAEQQQLFHVVDSDTQGTERRIIYKYFKGPNEGGQLLTRSIMTIKRRDELPHEYRLLRVWEEDDTCDSEEEELYGLANLRYLAYQRSFRSRVESSAWKIPCSVYLMWNLQTLFIQNYALESAMVVAPVEIWKMRQLRHVQYTRIYLPDPPPSNEVVMDNLQTLKATVNLRLSEEVCNIIPNIKKLHLFYDRNLQGYDDSLIECLCNLDRLHKLESLKLDIKSSSWPFRYPEMNKKLRFPSSLNQLSLSQCQLDWDDLTIIGSLPHLQVLSLEILSVNDGERWSPIEGQFLRLKFLKIEYCYLRYWDTNSSHFPVLEKLLLKGLIYFEEIPLDISNISTLKLIRLDDCTDSAVVSVLQIKNDQIETQGDDTDTLQIQVKIYNSELENFKERVETEGLSLDSIQLEIY